MRTIDQFFIDASMLHIDEVRCHARSDKLDEMGRMQGMDGWSILGRDIETFNIGLYPRI